MSKEMNKLKSKVTKYNTICGLFMSLIIVIVFNSTISLIYFMGMCIAGLNFNLNVYSTTKWAEKSSLLVMIASFTRIFLAVGCIIPFIHNFKLVVAYLLGFISHYVVLVYCAIKEKGSA